MIKRIHTNNIKDILYLVLDEVNTTKMFRHYVMNESIYPMNVINVLIVYI